MFKRLKNSPFTLIFLLIGFLLLPALACGSETPEKVGEVSEATPVNAAADEQPAATAVDEEAQEEATEPTAEATEPTTEATEPPQTTFAVGDIIEIGDISMVVLGWSTPAGDEFSQPEEGNQFVLVDVLFANTGKTADSLSSLLQMQLKDSSAQVYNPDLMASVAANVSSPEGEIAPGERLRGSIGFQTPQDATGLQFVFDASVFGSGRVFVNLGDEPVAVDPPAELAGETAATTFAVGDVIEIGDLGLTVHGVIFPTGDQFSQPEEGMKFLVVDVSVENKSEVAQSISSLLQMALKDATGQSYDEDLMADVAGGGTAPNGELAPGETIRGQVGFQVPADDEGFVFVFDGDVFGTGKVFVALPNQ